MRTQHALKIFVAGAFTLALISVAPQIARAQRCPNSLLTYIVRDERGQPIDGDTKELTLGPKEQAWHVGSADFLNQGYFAKQMATRVSPAIAQLNGKVRPLIKSKNCGFTEPIKLELELNEKKMKLIFRPKALNDNSIDYLIDSPPFQEGIFDLDLIIDKAGRQSAYFYPGSSCLKVTEADEAFYDGEERLGKKDYEHAIELFQKALTLDPKNAEAAFFIGDANISLKRYDAAITALKQATNINPQSATAYSLLGTAFRLNRQDKEAVDAYSTALKLGAKDQYWNEGWEKNTRDYLQKSQSALDPNSQKTAQDYFDEGMNYFGAKKYREAVESLTKATKAKPDYAAAFTPLGIAYIQLEMYEEAIAPLREAIRLDPSRGLSHGALGQAYLNLGLNKDAAAEFKEAARLEPAREMWRDGLKDAMDALDAPPYDFVKQEAEKLWRLNNPEYLKDATNVAFKYRSIGVKRQPKGVLRPAGTGSAGNSIEPLYSSDIKLTASVTYNKPREYVVDYQEEDHLCFYKKTGETTWSAALCERATKELVKVDPKVLDQYVGEYQMPASASHPEFVLKVFREGDKLMSEAFGRLAEFLPHSDNEFYMKEEDVELRFVRDAQGKVTHIDWGGTIVKKIK